LESVPGVVNAGWKRTFGSEAVAWSDADHVVFSNKQAEEWDFGFRMPDAVAAAVEHEEDGEAICFLRTWIRTNGPKDDDSRRVAVAYADIVDRFSDIFGTG
jgi:hypothetical protein